MAPSLGFKLINSQGFYLDEKLDDRLEDTVTSFINSLFSSIVS